MAEGARAALARRLRALRHRRGRPGRRHRREARRPRLPRLRRARAARACRRGSFPGDRDSVRTFSRHLGAPPAARGAARVSGEARGQAGAPAAVRRLRPASGRRARRRRVAARASSAAHEDLRVDAGAAPHAGLPRRAWTRRACRTSSASSAASRWTRAECRFKEPLFLPAHGQRRVVALRARRPGRRACAGCRPRCRPGSRAAGLYEPEKRPWLPHVTVARFRRPGHPFSLQNVNIGEFGVVRMVLYSSHLERAGAVHTPVADFPAS